MEKVESDTFLRDILSSNEKNTTNIENRVVKVLGIVSQIMDLLKSVSFWKHLVNKIHFFFVHRGTS